MRSIAATIILSILGICLIIVGFSGYPELVDTIRWWVN